MSALHLFRRQYMQGKHDAPHGPWCSKEAWQEVRCAFDSLPQERKDAFEKERLALVGQNKTLTKKKSEIMPLLVSSKGCPKTTSSLAGEGSTSEIVKVADASVPSNVLTVAGTSCQAPILSNLLPSDSSDLTNATSSLEDLAKATTKRAAELLESTETTVWPVEESNVLACLTATRAKGMSLQGACKEFSERCQMIAGPESDQVEFPQTVTIHGQCGALCQLEYTVRERLLHGEIVSALQKVASFDKPTKVVQSDMLLVCLVNCGGNITTKYFFLTAVSNKGGYNKPDAVHVLCKLVSQDHRDDAFESW